MIVTLASSQPAEALEQCCAFCDRIAGGLERSLFPHEQFVTWASAGPLVAGHVLVIPTGHALNAATLDLASRVALAEHVDVVAAALSRLYGSICSFEHGPHRPGSPVGCSVDHAHLHLLPWHGSLATLAVQTYPELAWRSFADGILSGLDTPGDESYLLVQDSDGCGVIGIGNMVPSQAMRRAIASATGRPEEWDWKTYPQIETQAATMRTLLDR